MEWGLLVCCTASDAQFYRSVEVAAVVEAIHQAYCTGAMHELKSACSERLEWLDDAGSCCRRSTCTCTCITDVLASRPQLHIRMTVRHNSTCICMCSGEAAQDLGPKGKVGQEGRCSVRTKSFGWRVRLGDPPCYRDIWERCQLDCSCEVFGRTMAKTYLSHAKTLLQQENLQLRKAASACLTLRGR